MKVSISFSRLTSFLRLASDVVSRSSSRRRGRSSFEIDRLQHAADRLGADAGLERVLAVLVERLEVLLLVQQLVHT